LFFLNNLNTTVLSRRLEDQII